MIILVLHASVVLAVLLLYPSFLAGAAVDAQRTYYLHGVTPAGNAEMAVAGLAGAVAPPSMDPAPPTLPAPKAAASSPVSNENYRQNFLNTFWAGALTGHVYGAHATIWLASASGATADVMLFGNGSAGPAVPFATAHFAVPAHTAPTPFTVDVSMGDAMIDGSLTLEVAFATTPGDLTVLYDATTAPSSLTFSLGAYVAPPPLGGGDGGFQAPAPASGWGNVSLTNDTWANREASLAIDPTNDDHLAMCFPTGVPQTTYGHSYFDQSLDGGATWLEMQVEQKATDTREYAYEGGDCDIAYDAGGTLYTADTWLGDLSVGHRTDNGKTWDGTAIATTAPVVDRPWLVGGPAGTLHLTWQDVQAAMPTAIWYERSTDYGQTFTPAVPIAVADAAHPFSWEGNLVVAPGGQDLYLVHTQRTATGEANLETSGIGAAGPELVRVAASHNGGLAWASTTVTSTTTAASYLYPSMGRDAAGGLHVVWAQNDSTDQAVHYAYSADQGASWSAPVKVLAGVGAYGPWIVGGKTAGSAAVAWLGTPDPIISASQPHDWYFYAGRVTGADKGAPVFSVMKTTQTPIFSGNQTMPEFNQVRLDRQDRIHLGMSAFVTGADGSTSWGLFHQMTR